MRNKRFYFTVSDEKRWYLGLFLVKLVTKLAAGQDRDHKM
jgi:hypothetical protein